jgi:hypothetical protein
MAEFEITHPDILSPTNKLDDKIYAKKHNFSGQLPLENLPDGLQSIVDQLGGKILLGYEFVDEKNLPAETTSVIFDELDLETDGGYLIEFNVLISNPSFPYQLYLLPNNSSSNLRSSIAYFYSSPGSGTRSFTDKVPLAHCNTPDNPLYIRGKCTVERLPNYYKSFMGESSVDSSREVNRCVFSSLVSNAINLTSLTCTCTSGTFSGTIRLWKKILIE